MSSSTNVINFQKSNERVAFLISSFNKEIKEQGLSVKYRLTHMHESLLQKLIREYGTKLNSSSQDPRVSDNLLRVKDNTVPYYTNDNRRLRDTTSNYISRLEKFGFISVRQSTRLEIMLHPNLIQFNPEVKSRYKVLKPRMMVKFNEKAAKIEKKLKTDNQDVNNYIVGKTCIKYITHYYNNLINKDVDKLNANASKPKVEKLNSNNTAPVLSETKFQEPQQNRGKILEKRENYFGKTSKARQFQLEREKKHQALKEAVQEKVDYLWKFTYTNFYEGKIGANHRIKFLSQSQKDFAKAFFQKQFNNVSRRDLHKKTKEIKSVLNRWKRFLKGNSTLNTPLPTVFFGPGHKFSYNQAIEWARLDMKAKALQNLKGRIASLFSWHKSDAFKKQSMAKQTEQFKSLDKSKNAIIYKEKWKDVHTEETVVLYATDYEELVEYYEKQKYNHINQTA